MPTNNTVTFDSQGLKVWLAGQQSPLIQQEIHPSGRAWRSREEALTWGNKYLIGRFGGALTTDSSLDDEVVEDEGLADEEVEEAPPEEPTVDEE
jgi:hypothetical protein